MTARQTATAGSHPRSTVPRALAASLLVASLLVASLLVVSLFLGCQGKREKTKDLVPTSPTGGTLELAISGHEPVTLSSEQIANVPRPGGGYPLGGVLQEVGIVDYAYLQAGELRASPSQIEDGRYRLIPTANGYELEGGNPPTRVPVGTIHLVDTNLTRAKTLGPVTKIIPLRVGESEIALDAASLSALPVETGSGKAKRYALSTVLDHHKLQVRDGYWVATDSKGLPHRLTIGEPDSPRLLLKVNRKGYMHLLASYAKSGERKYRFLQRLEWQPALPN